MMQLVSLRILPRFLRTDSLYASRNLAIFARNGKVWKHAPALLGALALALTAAPAFAQRAGAGGGSSHFAGGSSHSDGGVSHAGNRVTAASGSHSVSSQSSARTAQPPSATQSQNGFFAPANAASASSARSQSTSRDAVSSASAFSDAYPRKVTIGFPPAGSSDSILPSTPLLRRGIVVEGQRNELWAVSLPGPAPQHPSAPAHAAPPVVAPPPIVPARPVVVPGPAARPSRAPVSGSRFVPLHGHAVGTASRPTFWFLARQPRVSSPPRVFSPRPRRPGQFGGFGFFPGSFGFGFPFIGLGFFPDCNPFWAWPWAYGCGSLGYWNGINSEFGYNGGFYTQYEPEEQEPEQPEAEQLSEGISSNVFIPPPEPSSPEEIQAEKTLTVLFMKDGAVYAITDYWVADGKLYYLTAYGAEDAIDMNDLDLQKTVDVNAKRGVSFTLKPKPDQNPPPPDQQNPPDPQQH